MAPCGPQPAQSLIFYIEGQNVENMRAIYFQI